MAKPIYKIPAHMDTNWLELEIPIRSSSGVGFKPLPMKFILSVIFAGLGLFWMIQVTPVGSMGIAYIAAFSVAWLLTAALLIRLDKTGELVAARLPILVNYLPKSARKVSCRTGDSVGPFYSIANIDSIDEDRGIVNFADGTCGYVFRVVGSGSVLLFDEDRDAILDRVDAFYRTMKTDYEIIFITVKEAQNVRRQVMNMDTRLQNLKLRRDDPDLIALANMERRFLTDYVGREYRAIGQYMILKAGSREALEVARNMLQSEVENSTLMIKRCVQLYDDELHSVFRSIYDGCEETI